MAETQSKSRCQRLRTRMVVGFLLLLFLLFSLFYFFYPFVSMPNSPWQVLSAPRVLKVPLAEPTCVVLRVGEKHTSPSTSTKQRKHGPHESTINLGLQVACPKNGVLTDRLETVAAVTARKTQGKDDHHTIDPAIRLTPPHFVAQFAVISSTMADNCLTSICLRFQASTWMFPVWSSRSTQRLYYTHNSFFSATVGDITFSKTDY